MDFIPILEHFIMLYDWRVVAKYAQMSVVEFFSVFKTATTSRDQVVPSLVRFSHALRN